MDMRSIVSSPKALAFILGACIVLFPAHSIPASALTFGDVINVSNTTGNSLAPQMAIAENGNVYVVWQDTEGSQDIFFRASVDPTAGFGESVNISNDFTSESGARIAASSDRVSVVWFENDGEIYYTSSNVNPDGRVSFNTPVNLSNNVGDSRNPQIAASGQTIYVVWEDDLDGSSIPDIFFTNSTDGGQTFSTPVNLSDNGGSSRNPRIAVSEFGNVYVSWQDDSPNPENEQAIFVMASLDGGISFGDAATINNPEGFSSTANVVPTGENEFYLVWEEVIENADIFFARGTIENLDASVTFGNIVNVSDNAGFSTSPLFAVSNSGIIYVAWIDDITGGNDVLISNSTDEGGNFSPSVSLSLGASVSSGSFQLMVLPSNGEDLYLVWRDGNVGGGEIFIVEITNGGHNIASPINLSDNAGISNKPVLGAFNESLYVVWHDNSSGNNEVLFLAISADAGESPSIAIQTPSDETPKWGRVIEISGTTNGAPPDSVTVEWGDGSSTKGISISESSWGPVSHTYNSTGVGSKEIVAKLVDSDSNLKASSLPRVVTVLKHETTLTIEAPTALIQGSNLAVSGVLTDSDDNTPISAATITFEGTGSLGLADALTGAAGVFIGEGPSPDSPGTLWSVQARFLGDLEYESSDSPTVSFDTSSPDATQFTVPLGSPSVDLLGFNASIRFDHVTNEGTLFVSSCDAPDSARYLSIDLCIIISYTEPLPPSSFAHLTLSYANHTFPSGSEDELDVFHEAPVAVVDITESRDTEKQTVTGRVSSFSKFVVGVAVHEPPDEDTIRKQVFVGRNDIVFDELALRSINFDASEYSIGSTVTVTVQDPTMNLDEFSKDVVSILLRSASDSEGVTITLLETGNNTGVFNGAFELGDHSSNIDGTLRVDPGDNFSGSYFSAARGPLTLIFDDIRESGVVDVRAFTVDPRADINIPDFDPVGDGYHVRLVDAQPGNNSEVTVVMSYANVDLTNDEIISTDLFRILQFDPESITSGAFEWLDITSLEGSDGSFAIDPVHKTVTGATTFLGNFTIGHDVRDIGSGPGGGGGGIPRPGTGIILLDSAVVAGIESDDRRSGSGGGGGGQRSTAVTQTPSGTDVQTSASTGSGSVTLRFESVEAGSGPVTVESSQLSTFGDIFDDMAIMAPDNDEHGIVRLDGAIYSTAGSIFDIDVSEVKYQGAVEVTIPYDENAAKLLSGSESNVRFLHYDEESGVWEDATASVDELANTVTGVLDSLSPVTAAVIIGQGITFDEEYFEENPLARMEIGTPSFVVSEQTGEVTISTTVKNMQRMDQEYVAVVQIVDANNIAHYIDWATESAASAQYSAASINWKPMEKGSYSIMIFICTDLDNPILLSTKVLADIDI